MKNPASHNMISHETLGDYLNALTDKQREVAKLTFEGYKQREIAQMLGISQSAVSCRLAGARDRLRGIFDL